MSPCSSHGPLGERCSELAESNARSPFAQRHSPIEYRLPIGLYSPTWLATHRGCDFLGMAFDSSDQRERAINKRALARIYHRALPGTSGC